MSWNKEAPLGECFNQEFLLSLNKLLMSFLLSNFWTCLNQEVVVQICSENAILKRSKCTPKIVVKLLMKTPVTWFVVVKVTDLLVLEFLLRIISILDKPSAFIITASVFTSLKPFVLPTTSLVLLWNRVLPCGWTKV